MWRFLHDRQPLLDLLWGLRLAGTSVMDPDYVEALKQDDMSDEEVVLTLCDDAEENGQRGRFGGFATISYLG